MARPHRHGGVRRPNQGAGLGGVTEKDRIRAHVQLCWLALLLIRVIENTAYDTWRNIRHELDRMHLVTLATPDGQVAQRSVTTPGQQAILGGVGQPGRRIRPGASAQALARHAQIIPPTVPTADVA
jgi:hypothetical protein